MQKQAQEIAPGKLVATVMWLGYDTPDRLVHAGSDQYADDGDNALKAFVNRELPAVNHRHNRARVTVVGHSYGSFVTGQAAKQGMKADDVVLVGSPGVEANHARQLGDPDHIWVARAVADPIALATNTVHGPDPTSPFFGGRRFRTGMAVGHSEYYGEPDGRENESSRNIARIIAGKYDKVSSGLLP
jgi:pimeloyl-ACP methyl ester carboxylesterase